MLSDIINYGIRILIIVLGILFLSGVLLPEQADQSFVKIIGVIFILFGVYRIISYYSYKKREQRAKSNESKYDFSIKNTEDDKNEEK